MGTFRGTGLFNSYKISGFLGFYQKMVNNQSVFSFQIMKVLTPEIAWHETLPIYSCDLQPLTTSKNRQNHFSTTTPREPLNEIPLSEFLSSFASEECDSEDPNKTLTKEINEKENESCWTRLATAGGDNAVRLWRVNLEWTPPSSVTVRAFKKPLPKGMLGPAVDTKAASSSSSSTKKSEGGFKVSADVTEGLVFLATLRRHERLVNVVRWSPSGKSVSSGYVALRSYNYIPISAFWI